MYMQTFKVTSITQGSQITLPVEVRRILGVKPKDKIAFAIENDEVKLVPVQYTIESAAGSVRPATKTEDLERKIDEAKEEMANEISGH